MSETPEPIHDALRHEQFEADNGSEASPPSFDDVEARAAYWRMRFEEERELLAKLWVAYRDVEAELEAHKEETETIARRKAAAQLAQAEQVRAEEADDADPGDHPGVLAIAPPDAFEVMCEAEERDVIVGRGTSFPLVFVNRGEEPVEASLSVEETPEGWSALTTEQHIELDARSSRTVYVLVRPPAEAPAGEQARIVAAVATSDGTEETIALVAEVVQPPEEQADDPQAEADEDAQAPEPVEPEGETEGANDTADAVEPGEDAPA